MRACQKEMTRLESVAGKKLKHSGWLYRLDPGRSGTSPDQVQISVKRLDV